MIAVKRTLLLLILVFPAAACTTAPPSVDQPSGMTRAERNLCEAMRSYFPYRPGDCLQKR